jgi:hypothetical protein
VSCAQAVWNKHRAGFLSKRGQGDKQTFGGALLAVTAVFEIIEAAARRAQATKRPHGRPS